MVLLESEMNVNALTRMERKVKGGGRSESLSKNWIPVLARAYLVDSGGKTQVKVHQNPEIRHPFSPEKNSLLTELFFYAITIINPYTG